MGAVALEEALGCRAMVTAEVLADAWCEQAVKGVRTLWATALPPIVFDAWWAEGSRGCVYTAMKWRGEPQRLAWYAGIDPQPAGPAATTAARSALAAAARRGAPVELIVAAIPLEREDLIRSAKRAARDSPIAALIVRLREPNSQADAAGLLSALDATTPGDEQWVMHAVASQWLHAQGHTQRAAEALSTAWQNATTFQGVRGVMLNAVRALNAWSSIPALALMDEQAAFFAALGGHEPALSLALEKGWSLTAAALAMPEVPDAWRASLLGRSEDDWQMLLGEGLVSSEEHWAGRFGAAACAADRATQLDLLVLEAMAHAKDKASTDVTRFALRPAHQPQLVERLVREVTPKIPGVEPNGYGASVVSRLLDRIATAGGRAEARELVEHLERSIGSLSTPEGFVASWKVEMLATAAGRSREAAAHLSPYDSNLTRARVATALAADGHLAEAEPLLVPLVEDHLGVPELEALAPAIGLLAPTAIESGDAALAEAVASLPGSNVERSRAWLQKNR